MEPLDENLPNMPSKEEAEGRIVRFNDGNDSNVQRNLVLKEAKKYKEVFFNTAINHDLEGFGKPVVLTVNPGEDTDKKVELVSPIPKNLMFVRFRTNAWNLGLCDEVIEYYTSQKVPVVLTFMAYYNDSIPDFFSEYYSFRKRTLSSYWVINPDVWDIVMDRYSENQYVYSCGKDAMTFKCERCGTCLREYYATKERMRGQ